MPAGEEPNKLVVQVSIPAETVCARGVRVVCGIMAQEPDIEQQHVLFLCATEMHYAA